VKGNLEKNIIFYNWYVDDILINFDDNKITADDILVYMNSLHKHFKFKVTNEENRTIGFLDLLITTDQEELPINIFRKSTTTHTPIHYNSNHPMEHKLAAYWFFLYRLHQLPLSQDNKKQKMNTILQISQENGYSLSIINQLNNRIINAKHNLGQDNIHIENSNKRITFEYHSPLARKITNIFKHNFTYRKSCINHNP
jgi:hypothetical protein